MYYTVGSINLLLPHGMRKNSNSSGGNQLIKLTVVIIKKYHCYQQHTKLYPVFLIECYHHTQKKLLGTINGDFEVTDQLLLRYSALRETLEKKWEYNETVYQLFVDFEKVYDSIRREVLYNDLVEYGMPMKLVRLIKLSLKEICTYFLFKMV
jgi:hypothetical protein